MQNLTTCIEENEISRFSQLLQRIKIAFKLIANPKAIVIINSKIDAFQTSPEKVADICGKIHYDIQRSIYEDKIITQSINNLVYN
ncbi:hypothetical protein [Flavobacterium fluviatile]|uniref:hypothetical protein n=1 Tax=Flavobacterium fluviatile TaxID=1862387 RepID=UPI0013CFC4B2|nr:hypothetical protein [Flavobacterium fluviatile]